MFYIYCFVVVVILLLILLLLRTCHVQIVESFQETNETDDIKETDDLYTCDFNLVEKNDITKAKTVYEKYLHNISTILDKYEKREEAHLKIKSEYRNLENVNKQVLKLLDDHSKLKSHILKLRSNLKFGLKYVIYNFASTIYPFDKKSVPPILNEGIILKDLNNTKYKSIKKSCMIEYKAFFIPEQDGLHQFEIETNKLAMLYIDSKLILTVDYTSKRKDTIEYDMIKDKVYSFCLIMCHDPKVKNTGTHVDKKYIRESEIYTTHLDLTGYGSTEKVYLLVTPSNTSSNNDVYLDIGGNHINNIRSSVIMLNGGAKYNINKYVKKIDKSYHKGVSQIIDNNNIRIGNNSWNIQISSWNELGTLRWKHKQNTEWRSSYSKCFYQSIDTIQTIEKENRKLQEINKEVYTHTKIRDDLERSVLKHQIQQENTEVELPKGQTIDDLYSNKFKIEEKLKNLEKDGLVELDNYVSTNENTPVISNNDDKQNTICYKQNFSSENEKFTKIGNNFYESVDLKDYDKIIYSDIHNKS